jgi:hypothetical protein
MVQAETDIVAARTRGRAFARLMGLSSAEATVVATMVPELARSLQRQTGGELIVAQWTTPGGTALPSDGATGRKASGNGCHPWSNACSTGQWSVG